MKRTADDLLLGGYMARIARVFSRHHGVKVVLGGAVGLRTDMKTMTIYVPATVESLKGSDRNALEGALDHEVAHVRAEKEAAPGDRHAELAKGLDRLEALCLNLVEDVRIELDACRRWVGVEHNLNALREWAAKQPREAEGEDAIIPAFIHGFYMRGVGRLDLLKGEEPVADLLAHAAPELECAKSAKTARDSLQVAKVLADLLRRYAPPLAPEMKIHLCVGECEEGEGDESHEATPTLRTAIQSAIAKLGQHARQEALADVGRVLPHPDAAAQDDAPQARQDRHGHARVFDAAQPHIGGVATRLALLLRCPAPTRVLDREEGDLDPSTLAQVPLGLRTPFNEIRKLRALSAAGSVLVDCSGSMQGDKLHQARVAALVLGEAFNRAGVPFEVHGWHDLPAVSPQGDEAALYTRFERKRTLRVKGFSEPWRACRERVAGLEADGVTDDAGALLEAAGRLSQRPEKLKVLLVLTDGQPYHSGSTAKPAGFLEGLLKATVARVERSGIKLGGVGILSEHVEAYYTHHVHVERIQDLGRCSVELLGRMMGRRLS